METFIFTVLAGVIIFVLGQFIVKFIIEPAQELKKTISGISYLVLLYQGELTNAISSKDIALDIEIKSAEIISKSDAILFFRFAKVLLGLPTKSKILEASRELNRISYGMKEEAKTIQNSPGYDAKKTDFAGENTKALIKVGKLLNIKTGYS